MKIIAHNKKAFHEFSIKEVIEAGIVLQGTEVKSIRLNHVSLNEAYVSISKNTEAFIENMSVAPYEFGTHSNHLEKRKRKLLLHKKQIETLLHKIKIEGVSIIPIKMYFSKGKIKIELGIGKGKKLYDKRQDEKKQDIEKKLRRNDFHNL